jgi:DNA-binding transcriptional MocR family regulator
VTFAPGIIFSSSNSHRNFIRLAISFYEKHELLEGLKRFCKLLSEKGLEKEKEKL